MTAPKLRLSKRIGAKENKSTNQEVDNIEDETKRLLEAIQALELRETNQQITLVKPVG